MGKCKDCKHWLFGVNDDGSLFMKCDRTAPLFVYSLGYKNNCWANHVDPEGDMRVNVGFEFGCVHFEPRTRP